MKILYIVIVLIILGGIGYIFLNNNTPAEAPVVEENVQETEESDAVVESDHVFDVVGTNFTFDITEMRVQEGDTVTVNLVSGEGFHDWVVDEFGAATEKIREGETTSVTFVARTAGTYEYYCSVGSHRAQGMVGTLIVE